jgi:hypothetical protein
MVVRKNMKDKAFLAVYCGYCHYVSRIPNHLGFMKQLWPSSAHAVVTAALFRLFYLALQDSKCLVCLNDRFNQF